MKRVALVIGNAKYGPQDRPDDADLINPVNDALRMTETLEGLGFKVTCKTNLTRSHFRRAIDEFIAEAAGAESDAALLFYSGHAVEVDGINYMVPVNAEMLSGADLSAETINVTEKLRMLRQAAKVSLVFLDACRDNPFRKQMDARSPGQRGFVVADRGLAKVEKAELKAAFVALAAEAGRTATDGEPDGLSPFTEALVENIGREGVDIVDVMRSVRRAVRERTNNQQLPWSEDALEEPFFFRPRPPEPPLGPPTVIVNDPLERRLLTNPTVFRVADPSEPVVSADDKVPLEETASRLRLLAEQIFAKLGTRPIVGLTVGATLGTIILAAPVYENLKNKIGGTWDLIVASQPPQIGTSATDNLTRLDKLIPRIGDIGRGDAAVADAAVAFMNGNAALSDKKLLLTALLRMLRLTLSVVEPTQGGDPLPGPGCRFPTEYARGALPDQVQQICSGLDPKGLVLGLSVLEQTVPKIADDANYVDERAAASIIVADMAAQERAGSNLVTGVPAATIRRLQSYLPQFRDKPTNKVTLQFAGGEFLRGNAQVIMDRLVSLGWKLDGVQRDGNAANLNEVRFGANAGTSRQATALSDDLLMVGIRAAPSANAVINRNPQLDIYISRALPTWERGPPQAAWCFHRRYPSGAAPYSVRCYQSISACLRERQSIAGNPGTSNSGCAFLAFLDETQWRPTYGGGPNQTSWYEMRASEFPAPFPALPAN